VPNDEDVASEAAPDKPDGKAHTALIGVDRGPTTCGIQKLVRLRDDNDSRSVVRET
jgi:hypothetical protein